MFLSALSQMQSSIDKLSIYSPSSDALNLNPVKYCLARPFLYPALSERPWFGVIEGGSKCEYLYYGFDDYISKRPQNDLVYDMPQFSPSQHKFRVIENWSP